MDDDDTELSKQIKSVHSPKELPLLGPPLEMDEDDTDLLKQIECLQDELKQLCISIEMRYLDPSNPQSLSKIQLEADKLNYAKEDEARSNDQRA
jgi:hypothetical protein